MNCLIIDISIPVPNSKQQEIRIKIFLPDLFSEMMTEINVSISPWMKWRQICLTEGMKNKNALCEAQKAF
jgi:hypothetical protein